MKNNLFIVLMILFTLTTKSQTCGSPIILPAWEYSSPWQSIDSFSVNSRWLRFNADGEKLIFKVKVFNYSPGNHNIYLYQNNCSPLTLLNATVTVSNDTITLKTPVLTFGSDYLIKLENLISPTFMKYKLNKAYDNSTTILGCQSSSTCYPSNCEFVCNGSFECFSNPPINNQQWSTSYVNLLNWKSGSVGSPDMYCAFSPPQISVPCNYAGYSAARTGNSYMGIIIAPGNTFPREYLQTQLTQPTQAGKTYEVSFYVKKASGVGLESAAEIGAYLTPNQIYINNNTTSVYPNLNPIGSTTNTFILNDYLNWNKVSFIYTSLPGNELYLTIGSTSIPYLGSSIVAAPFFSNCPPANTQTNTSVNYAYLFIDDVSVKEYVPPTSFTLPPITCQNQMRNLNSYLSTPGGGTFTGVGVTQNAGTYYFNAAKNVPAGTYTVVYTYTAGTLCTQTISLVAITTVPSTSTLNLTASNYVICTNLGQNSSTLTVSSSFSASPGYTWQPGSILASSLVVLPTATSIYTVNSSNQGCLSNATIAITVNSACCNSTVTPFVGNTFTSSIINVTSLVFNNDVEIPNGITMHFAGGSNYLFAPGVKLTIKEGGAMAVTDAHFYSCSTEMWQGIVIEDSARIQMQSSGSGLTNLIEDAVIALDYKSTRVADLIGQSIINVQYTTFNKNYIAINISNYRRNWAIYPFVIHNCLFTSRTLTFTPILWPSCYVTAGNLRAVSSATDGLAVPYLINNFPISNLKSPYNTQPGHIGIKLSSVGSSTGTVHYGPQIGRTTLGSDYNIFDGLGQLIEATNSNVLCVNNVFQNTQQYTVDPPGPPPPYTFGGNAVRNNVTDLFNSKLDLWTTTNNYSFGNRFYDCHYAVNCDNTYALNVRYATFRSTQSSTNSAFAPGNTGVVARTNRFNYTINDNNLANIKTPINVPISAGNYSIGTLGYGIYAKQLVIQNNYIGAHINPTISLSSGQYVNQAVSISAPIGSTFVIGSANCAIQSNTISRVYRGIDVNGVSKSNHPVITTSNTVYMVDDLIPASFQSGINYANNTAGIIKQNTVSATAYTNSSVYTFGVWCEANYSPSVTCNAISNTFEAFSFTSYNLTAAWKGNTMINHARGLVHRYNSIMNTQGSSGNPIDNQWNGSWASSDATLLDWTSDATNSKLWIRIGSPWQPPTNSGYGGFLTWYSAPGNTLSTLGSFSCNSGGPPPPSGLMQNNFESSSIQNIFNSSKKAALSPELIYIEDFGKYNVIKGSNTFNSINTFDKNYYSNLDNSSMKKLKLLEDYLFTNNLNGIKAILASISPTNNVEQNYADFYNLFFKYATDNFTASDLNSLEQLALLCPGTNGAVVYQARALRSYISKDVFIYDLLCNEKEQAARGANKENITESNLIKNWSVSLFPNPNSGSFSVISKSEKENLSICIRDISGKILCKQSIETENFVYLLNMNLDSGVYFVTIINAANESVTKKVVVSK